MGLPSQKEGEAKIKIRLLLPPKSERLEAERGREGEQSDAVEHVHLMESKCDQFTSVFKDIQHVKIVSAQTKIIVASLPEVPCSCCARADVLRDEFEGFRAPMSFVVSLKDAARRPALRE